jgi:membrane fusion protein, multidrug efflux system
LNKFKKRPSRQGSGHGEPKEETAMRMFIRIVVALLGLLIVVGGLAGIKGLQIKQMIAQGQNFAPPPEIVTTALAQADSWEVLLTSVGSLEAVQGVEMTAELPGKVVRIAFEPGAVVQAGDLLVQQDTSVEAAQLRSAEAAVALAKINFERAKELVASKTVSQSTFDNADAQFKQAEAQVDNIRALIAKKTIRAPFSGRLGIRLVNLGQIIKEGQVLVSLQALNPIYVNFLLPQQRLAQVHTGLSVRLTTDAYPDQAVSGKITVINPEVDAATRNMRIQATVTNADERLRPGMFATVAVVLPKRDEVMTIPATAILAAPYGDSVFIVEEKKSDKNEPAGMLVRQQFVRLGEKRGDFVSVLSGIKAGETVVSTGVFKLRNGQSVVVDNKLAPEFKKTPTPADA